MKAFLAWFLGICCALCIASPNTAHVLHLTLGIFQEGNWIGTHYVSMITKASKTMIEKITAALGILAVKQAFAANAVSCLLTNDAYQLKVSLTDFLWFDILKFLIFLTLT